MKLETAKAVADLNPMRPVMAVEKHLIRPSSWDPMVAGLDEVWTESKVLTLKDDIYLMVYLSSYADSLDWASDDQTSQVISKALGPIQNCSP